MNKNSGISFKLILAFIIVMVLVTVGSFLSMRMLMRDVGGAGEAEDAATYSRHYAFIYTGGDESLWDSIYEGARSRGAALGIYVEDFGAGLTADYDRSELIGIAAASSVDGIIVEGSADEDEAAAINDASIRGIPVVTVFGDCAESDRVCFVGFSNYNIGRQYGAELVNHGIPEDGMKIYVVMDQENAGSGQNLVISGISDEFSEHMLADRCRIEGVYVNNETAFTAEEDIRDLFLNSDLPDAMVALNSVYTRCLFQAAVDYYKTGSVLLYGFDDSEDILEAVSKNLLEATVSVDPTRMGESAVEALDEYINTGYVSNYIAQDTELILPSDAALILDPDNEEAQ